ncbi:DUF2125 domain-containing protein [Zavarzinia compransoris]|uniref:DUF2125 domain-containing protein n=1 Tax=Zavarzinia marina TaxID=2911065 RepID=UPI001F38D887|nr:DUF2125 domain-containing protein [Zavarzinia marina]MCF4166735.1 DUF2125 domain-containing protein [Zavarzinia marina]
MRISRRYLYLTLFVILAVAAWTFFWFRIAGEVRTRTDAWIAEQAAQGVEVTYGDMQVNGYPYRIEVTIADLAAEGLPRGGAFTVPEVTVLSLPWNPRLIVGSLAGETRFRWTDERGAAQSGTYAATSTGFSIAFEDGQAARFALSGDAPIVTATTLQGPLSAKVFEVHARRLAGGATPEGEGAAGDTAPTAPLLGEVAVDGTDVHLPANVRSPLGPLVEKIGYTVGLTGHIPTGRIPAPGPGRRIEDMAAEWARDGGTIELSRAETRWGPLNLTLTGSFSIDALNRPIGAISGRIGGLEPLIDGAVAEGRLRENQARGIKQALNALGFIAKDKEGRVPVSVTVQDGRVSVGPVPVGEVKPLF